MQKNTIDLRHMIKTCPDCAAQYSAEAVFCPFDGQRLVAGMRKALTDPLLGTTVDNRYRVVEVLGEGGMGTVYLVKHATLERSFAMKALRADLAREQKLAERFMREAKATAAIKHPNVVAINDFGSLPDGRPYYVMELLVGQSLASVIKKGGPVPALLGARIVTKVARALQAAHDAGVVHRDLKPENVFLVNKLDEADVRVVDFGAAMILGASRMTKQGIVFGTPHYMSPEQASGGTVDHRADVYALGIIMYEMFTGKVPFEGDTYMGVLTQHMYVQPTPPSQVNPEACRELGALEAITLRCLEKQPERRFSSMEELAKGIEATLRTTSDGRVSVAPYLDGGDSRGEPKLFHHLADEVELPSVGELRERLVSQSEIRSRRNRTIPIVVGVLVVCSLVVGYAAYTRTRKPVDEPQRVMVPTATPTPSPTPSGPTHHIVHVSSNVSADAYVGTALVGSLPLDLRVEPTSEARTLTIRASGYVDKDVVVDTTSPEVLRVDLQPKPKNVTPIVRATTTPTARPTATATTTHHDTGDLVDPWKK